MLDWMETDVDGSWRVPTADRSLSTDGSSWDAEPMVGLAVQLRALGAEVPVCAPPDFAERLARIGMPIRPAGPPALPLVTGASLPPRSSTPSPRRPRDMKVLVATGVMLAGVGL